MNTYLQYIITFCAVSGVIGITWAQVKRGRMSGSSEIIAFYQKEAASYKEMMLKERADNITREKEDAANFNKQIHELTEKYGKLQGQFTAEKDAREKAEQILKDKNPETIMFMNDTVSTLGEIRDFMEKLNQHMEDEKKRELHVEASITKT